MDLYLTNKYLFPMKRIPCSCRTPAVLDRKQNGLGICDGSLQNISIKNIQLMLTHWVNPSFSAGMEYLEWIGFCIHVQFAHQKGHSGANDQHFMENWKSIEIVHQIYSSYALVCKAALICILLFIACLHVFLHGLIWTSV